VKEEEKENFGEEREDTARLHRNICVKGPGAKSRKYGVPRRNAGGGDPTLFRRGPRGQEYGLQGGGTRWNKSNQTSIETLPMKTAHDGGTVRAIEGRKTRRGVKE